MSETGKRITYKPVCPNPLFQKWLKDLYKEAKEKKSKLEQKLKEALDSLSKYPLKLNSGAECVILKGFDTNLCKHLDKCLEVHNHQKACNNCLSNSSSQSSERRSNVSTPVSDVNMHLGHRSDQPFETITNGNSKINNNHIRPHASTSNSLQTINLNSANNKASPSTSGTSRKKAKGSKKYKPAYRSGAYAILTALLEVYTEISGEVSLTKEELIEKAQRHAEESFVRPKPDTFYTAWSNMNTLVKKELVSRVRAKKVKYQLTEQGVKLARSLANEYKNIPTMNDVIFKDACSTATTSSSDTGLVPDNVSNNEVMSSSSQHNVIIELSAGAFDIVLLIDKNETGGLSKKNDPTVAQFNKYPDLKHEYRSLKVGDFTWVARNKLNNAEELVLPYIIERKRMDDLAASIKDGRYHEQKFRLRKCGLENVIYLIESYGGNKHLGLPVQNLMQAIANTRIHDGFKVHMTDSLTNSARFLAMMTKRLTIRYQDQNLKGRNDDPKEDYLMTFDYFNKASAKTKALTVTETFIKLLLQLKGVSADKALAITAKYSTPRSLIIAYQKCDHKEGEFLLANLKYGELARNVGPSVSKAIYQLLTSVG